MRNLKKIAKSVWECISALIAGAFVAAWTITFVSITFALAIWSTQWLWSLL